MKKIILIILFFFSVNVFAQSNFKVGEHIVGTATRNIFSIRHMVKLLHSQTDFGDNSSNVILNLHTSNKFTIKTDFGKTLLVFENGVWDFRYPVTVNGVLIGEGGSAFDTTSWLSKSHIWSGQYHSFYGDVNIAQGLLVSGSTVLNQLSLLGDLTTDFNITTLGSLSASDGSQIQNLNASNISHGTIDPARLPSGGSSFDTTTWLTKSHNWTGQYQSFNSNINIAQGLLVSGSTVLNNVSLVGDLTSDFNISTNAGNIETTSGYFIGDGSLLTGLPGSGTSFDTTTWLTKSHNWTGVNAYTNSLSMSDGRGFSWIYPASLRSVTGKLNYNSREHDFNTQFGNNLVTIDSVAGVVVSRAFSVTNGATILQGVTLQGDLSSDFNISTTGSLSGDGSDIGNLNANNITQGTVNVARLPTTAYKTTNLDTSKISFIDQNETVTGVRTHSADVYANKRLHQHMGASTIASDNIITLGADGNFFIITGTTSVRQIDLAGWQNGDVIYLFNEEGFEYAFNYDFPGEIINNLSSPINVANTVAQFILKDSQWIHVD